MAAKGIQGVVKAKPSFNLADKEVAGQTAEDTGEEGSSAGFIASPWRDAD